MAGDTNAPSDELFAGPQWESGSEEDITVLLAQLLVLDGVGRSRLDWEGQGGEQDGTTMNRRWLYELAMVERKRVVPIGEKRV